MLFRRIPPEVKAGPLSRQDAAAINHAFAELYRLIGSLDVAPPLNATMDSQGMHIWLSGFTGTLPVVENVVCLPVTGSSSSASAGGTSAGQGLFVTIKYFHYVNGVLVSVTDTP